MRSVMRSWLAALCALAALPLTAGEITLHAEDGGLAIAGQLLSYDGAFYTVETGMGALTVHADRVRCDGAACPQEIPAAELTLAGDPLIGARLMPRLIEGFARARYMRAYREIHDVGDTTHVLLDAATGTARARLRTTLTGSDSGLIALLDGRADIAMSLAKLDDDDDLRVRRLALDALLPAVAPGNAVAAITLPRLSDALAGNIDDWTALERATPGALVLHLYPERSGIQHAIEAQLLGPEGLPLAEDVQRHAGPAALTAALAQDADGLGLALASQQGETRALELAGNCGRVARAHDIALRSGDYPLALPLYLITRAERLDPLARDFVAFLDSDAAARIIRRAGFVDFEPRRFRDPVHALRLPDAPPGALPGFAEAPGVDRITTTIRFEHGAAGLDSPARDALARLADALAEGLHGRRELVVAGFTDATETDDGLAGRRAAEVGAALRDAARMRGLTDLAPEIVTPGGLMPAACDDSAAGRATNRRVEIWLR